MKSLEIVKKDIEFYENRLKEIHLYQSGFPYLFDAEYEINITNHLKEQQQIKQSLEVLEIIYKKKVELELLEALLEYKVNEKILWAYNSNPARIKLTIEELQKLKQWLEENEDDNKSL